MNRLELLILLALLATAVIFVLKSKWFDSMVDSLLRGSKRTTPKDIRSAQKEIEGDKKKLKKDLDAEAKKVQTQLHEVEKL